MTVDSILEALRTYFKAYGALVSGTHMGVDFLGPDKVEYSIATMPGAERTDYVAGGSERTYPFAFQATLQTPDDTTRIENGAFFETLSDWLDTQNEAGTFPILPAGKTGSDIRAIDHGYLYQEGQSGTGVYQILCRLTYQQT